MASTSMASRKRRRVSEESVSDWDDDTIAVLPLRQTAAADPADRAPLQESTSRGNNGAPTRVASHAEATLSTPAAPNEPAPTPVLAARPAQASDDDVPPSACFRCRTRGGNAAYVCVYEDGNESCTTCVKQTKGGKGCRMPTEEELVMIAARCPQCVQRGHTKCTTNPGSKACEVCIRRGIADRCGQPLTKKAKRDNAQLNQAPLFAPMPGGTPSAAKTSRKKLEQATKSSQKKRPRRSTATDAQDDLIEQSPVAETVAAKSSQKKRPRRSTAVHVQDDASEQPSIVDTMEVDMTAEIDQIRYEEDEEETADIKGLSERALQELLGIQSTDRSEARSDESSPDEDIIGLASSMTRDSSAKQTEDQEISSSEDEIPAKRPVFTKRLSPVVLIPGPSRKSKPEGLSQKAKPRGLSAQQTGRTRRGAPRPSYVELFPEDISDQAPDMGDESDGYVSNASAEGSIVSDDYDLESLVDEDASSGEESVAVEVEEVASPKKQRAKAKPASASSRKGGMTWDFGHPPLNNIEEIFAHMTNRGVELGLQPAIEELKGRPINVATMCSGTESPLIALEMISAALGEDNTRAFEVDHHFSAEIDSVKQGYIERNFEPPKLFRDVREFIPEDATAATTAYGAKDDIPGSLDILVAGFVCKDLSTLNSSKKSITADGESGDTWRALYGYAKRFRPTVVLIENVRGQIAYWNYIVSEWDLAGYEAGWLFCDTKNYYLPQTRSRMYMIAIEREACGKGAAAAVTAWKTSMKNLVRPCSTPFGAFLKGTASELTSSSIVPPPKSEPAWVACKLKYDRIRSEERLGTKRPVTRWSENGSLRPPDFANHEWYSARSSREWECIDIAHQQRARTNYDTRYKMEVWDVSQSIDYYGAPLGIVGCITPNGCDFVTNEQTVLTGGQMLRLQGMPNDKLLFARETQKDVQDLAGNAMTTTVIGASLISALICGTKSFRKSKSTIPDRPQRRTAASETSLVTSSQTERHTLQPTKHAAVDVDMLLHDAYLSSRLCACEGTTRLCRSPVQVCEACSHTACAQHAGNPAHVYTGNIPRSDRTQTPHEFLEKWKQLLPTRLRFAEFPDIAKVISKAAGKDELVQDFVQHVQEADVSSQVFSIDILERQDAAWSITYTAAHVTLRLHITKEEVQWHLIVASPHTLRGDSALRKVFERPIARGLVKRSLMSPSWEFFVPRVSTQSFRIQASTETTSSWRSRIGLPDYKKETTPTELTITSEANDLQGLTGGYTLQPNCGTACDSMYKKHGSAPALFLYLDPDLVGHPDKDSFVFTHDLSRRVYGESRATLAVLDPAWRPWKMSDNSSSTVRASIPGSWVASDFVLASASLPIEVVLPTADSLGHLAKDCTQAITVLDVKVPEVLPTERISQLSWVLDQVKSLSSTSTWQETVTTSLSACDCAPSLPPLLWNVDADGNATAQEEPRAAAAFERVVKTRRPIFTIKSSVTSGETRVEVGLNIASLVHRARGRLSENTTGTLSWRLCTDHADIATGRFPKFTLLCNSASAPFNGKLELQHTLDKAQSRSLAWMVDQELGKPLTITEVEEATEPDLGLRAEARAQHHCTIRGGVLADRPSFGKTVTTIALIHSEFQQYSAQQIIERNQASMPRQSGLIALAATMIVCPPHIARQWQSELEKFLQPSQYKLYKVLIVEDVTQLSRLTIKNFQEARVVIVSWSVLSDPDYIAQLAKFVAMPEPATTKGSGFDAWRSKAIEYIPDRLAALEDKSYSEFKADAKELLEVRLSHPEFQATMPLKLRHGAGYQSFASMQIAEKSGKGKKKAAPKPTSTRLDPKHPIPFLELFDFNRRVLDEYHYLLDDKKGENYPAYAAVKSISASKAWVLSGTPALTNFSDINELASFLGVRLGRNYFGDGVTMTPFEKKLADGQTEVQKFLSRTEIMSRQWHEDRHARAQDFLDLCVRKNKPSLDHIARKEVLVAVTLDLVHHAVYLELSQHLIAMKMQLKKPSGKSNADRIDRLNDILNNSATAEDALLKRALLFETAEGESGIDLLIQKRTEERSEVEAEIFRLMVAFESLKQQDEDIARHYNSFKDFAGDSHELGDGDSSHCLRRLIVKAVKKAATSPERLPEIKGLSGEKLLKALKILISQLRERARELVLKMRSQRFITALKGLVPALLSTESGQIYKCDSGHCGGVSSIHQLRLITECGHLACAPCLKSRVSDETCVHDACSSFVAVVDQIKITDLGRPEDSAAEQSFGNKLDAIAELIQRIPREDQGIIFVPNQETITIVAEVLDYFEISYHALSGNKKTAAKLVEDFKTNRRPKDMKKVLILDLGSESASGINLTNANHVLFTAPLLAKSQYEFESAMAQAIARCLRYGQEKTVHVYHFAAMHTIDVDILEHRHRRKNGITTPTSSITLPSSMSDKKQKTKLIRNAKGDMALVPVSWLPDNALLRKLGVEGDPGNFTSLINFSETFEDEDD